MKLTDFWKDNNFVINANTVEQFNKWFEKDVKNTRYSTDETILQKCVPEYIHKNSSFEDIYTVVTLINSFYSTRMGADDCYALSKILHENHAKILKAIHQIQPNIELVQNIINTQQELKQQDKEIKRVAFSFTTKYFSILSRFYDYKDSNIREADKDLYPIYDSVVVKVLDYYFYIKTNKKSHVSSCKSNKDKKGYEGYVEIINRLKPTLCTYKHLDNYLWKIGSLISKEIQKQLNPESQKKRKGVEDNTEPKKQNEPSWFVLGKYNISLDELMKKIFDDKGGFNV